MTKHKTASLADRAAIPCERFALRNGLQVVAHVDRRRPIVHVSIGYRVGSKDEPAGRTGFAHLFEHLMFSGTRRLPGAYTDRLLDAGALEVNAYTDHDHTIYHEIVAPGMLRYALFAEADRMQHLGEDLTQEVLDRERAIVLREKLERESGPGGKLAEYGARRLYPSSHPYHHTVIGDEVDLRNATLADARDWCRSYYTPSNAVLTLVGDFDLEQARQWIDGHFAHIPPGPPLLRPRRWLDVPTGQRRDSVEITESDQGGLAARWVAPGIEHADGELLEVGIAMLNDGQPGLIEAALVGRDGPAEAVSPLQYWQGQLCGDLSLSIHLAHGASHREAEARLAAALQGFLDASPDPASFERVRRQMVEQATRPAREVSEKAHRLMTGMLQEGDPNGICAVIRRVEAATADGIHAALRRWLSPYAHYVVEFTPVGPFAAVPRADEPAVPTIERRTEDAAADKLPAAAVLACGALIRHSTEPDDEFAATLRFSRGQVDMEPRQRALAELSTRLPLMGIGDRSPGDTASLQMERSIRLNLRVDGGCFSIAVAGPSEQIPVAAGLLADCLRWSRQPDARVNEHFERQKQELGASLRRRAKDPRAFASGLPRRMLFGEGHPMVGTPEQMADELSHCTLSELRRFVDGLFQPAYAVLLLAGTADASPFTGVLESGWNRDAAGAMGPRTELQAPRPQAAVVQVVNAGGGNSRDPVELVGACMLPAYDPAADWPVQALVDILGGGASSRLNQRLREQLQWTYGVQAQIVDSGRRGAPRVLQVLAQVDVAHAAACMAEIESMLSGFGEPSAAEFANFVRARRLQWPDPSRSADEALAVMDFVQRFDLPDDHQVHSRRALETLQPSAVAAAAARWLSPSQWRWSMLGHAPLLLPALEGASIAAKLAVPPLPAAGATTSTTSQAVA